VEELSQQVAEGFGFKQKSYVRGRGIFICTTDRGIKGIRQVVVNHGKILFQHGAQEHLYNNGFQQIDRFILSTQNTPFYIHDGKTYIMTEWIEGRECDFDREQELQMAVSALAYMHQASKGFIPIEGSKIRSELGRLPEQLQRRIAELARMRKLARRQSSLSRFDILFLTNYEYYYTLCGEAIKTLENSGYTQLAAQVEAEKSFCHHDYTNRSVRINHQGQAYVKDFQQCCYDIPISDLANIMKRYMRKCEWDRVKAQRVIEIYHEICPITYEEFQVLTVMLKFPHRFWRVCNRYYNSRRTWNSEILCNRLQEIIVQKEKHKIFIDSLDFRQM
jgi:CotS family spore coat protein